MMNDEFSEMLKLYAQNQKQKVPEHTLDALLRYKNDRILPGGFLTKVLNNDLMGAYACADDKNIANMYAIVKYIYNEMPMQSWGSQENINKWVKGYDEKNIY